MKNKYTRKEKFNYILKKARGVPVHIDMRDYFKFAESVLSVEISSKSDEDLKRLFSYGKPCEAYAAVAEAAARTIGLRPYIEQVAAGRIMTENNLVQMQTGEGKTLAAVFPALFNASIGINTHILTANDYLAERDALWMGEIYSFFGFDAGYVIAKMDKEHKKKAYCSIITYLTAKQAGFDYLHDCISLDNRDNRYNNPFQSCIVDEADFILIDEARIPLVIARERKGDLIAPRECYAIAEELNIHEDYTLDHAGSNCILTVNGINKVCLKMGVDELSEEGRRAVAGVNVALHALMLLDRDVDYIVRDNSVELVDELTGRVAEHREWPYGIQRALEAKEGVSIRRSGEICGSVTVGDFIRMYSNISAMTATAEPAAMEFYTNYNLETYIIPPHLDSIRIDLPDMIFSTKKAKYKQMVVMIKESVSKKQPVLIGTSSVEESKRISDILESEGIKHAVLNAVQDRREAEIISNAGSAGAVTVSTNIAGRGTDIILGGINGEDSETARSAGGLLVIGLNRHESRRIDNQLRGRSGRQGDPGQSIYLLSLEDRLFKRYGIREFIPEALLHFTGDSPVTGKKTIREIARAQEIIEDQFSKMRKTLRDYAAVVEAYRKQIVRDRFEALDSGEFPLEIIDSINEILPANSVQVSDDDTILYFAEIFASKLDGFTVDFFEWSEHLREGIHLRRLGQQEPLLEYRKEVEKTFREGYQRTVNECCEFVKERGHDFSREIRNNDGTDNTWTYIIDDNPFPSFTLGLLGMDNAVAAAAGFMLSLVAPLFIFENILRRKRRNKN